MTASNRAQQIQEEYERILDRALREPGVAQVLEVHERVERAGGQSAPAGTMVRTTSSTSAPGSRSR
jgi:hypothetical protein